MNPNAALFSGFGEQGVFHPDTDIQKRGFLWLEK
jgi:hypothetical protein